MSVDYYRTGSKQRRAVINRARHYVGQVSYRFRAEDCHWPKSTNCYLFLHHVMSECGLAVADTLAGLEAGGEGLQPHEDYAEGGDIVFTNGLGHGHCGLLTGEETVIHASFAAGTVVEQLYRDFFRVAGRLRGFRRVIF